MSSVAVLTPESFAEHRSGLKDQEITGNNAAGTDFLLGLIAFFLETFLHLKRSSLYVSLHVYVPLSHLPLFATCLLLPTLFTSVSGGGPTGCVPEDEAYIPTYLEAFPPLPEKGAPGEKAAEQASAWGSKIRPIKASVITQVRHRRRPHAAV